MDFTNEQRAAISNAITNRYGTIATGTLPKFQYPTGEEGLKGQNYPQELIDKIPQDVRSLFCGVGNPFSLGQPKTCDRVLDVGCGAGVDTILAAMMVAPCGQATGLDPVPGLKKKAEENAQASGVDNADFLAGYAAALPFGDNVFDLVISNGALNLAINKPKVLKELLRVLRSGARLQMADQFLTGPPPLDAGAKVASWAG